MTTGKNSATRGDSKGRSIAGTRQARSNASTPKGENRGVGRKRPEHSIDRASCGGRGANKAQLDRLPLRLRIAIGQEIAPRGMAATGTARTEWLAESECRSTSDGEDADA